MIPRSADGTLKPSMSERAETMTRATPCRKSRKDSARIESGNWLCSATTGYPAARSRAKRAITSSMLSWKRIALVSQLCAKARRKNFLDRRISLRDPIQQTLSFAGQCQELSGSRILCRRTGTTPANQRKTSTTSGLQTFTQFLDLLAKMLVPPAFVRTKRKSIVNDLERWQDTTGDSFRIGHFKHDRAQFLPENGILERRWLLVAARLVRGFVVRRQVLAPLRSRRKAEGKRTPRYGRHVAFRRHRHDGIHRR